LIDQLNPWGWSDARQTQFDSHARTGLQPGRIVAAHRGLYEVAMAGGLVAAQVSGRHRHSALGPEDFPAVGDWVALQGPDGDGRAVIQHVLPRLSRFARLAVGASGATQVVAANVDTVFLVAALNRDFNLRRIERYVAAAWESGAQPVVVLSKADLEADPEARVLEAEAIAPGVNVHLVATLTGAGLAALAPYLAPGKTVALLGSSGAGKSTLLNALAGREVMETGGIRESDDRGRHTTTRRELVALPSGGLLIDTPGMRELGLLDATDGVTQAFDDVAALASACRFHDCAHAAEPGCAVQSAVDAGTLTPERLASYTKLQREAAYQARRTDQRARAEAQAKWKAIHKAMRNNPKR
jgi:ribosome biogenesis GTPase